MKVQFVVKFINEVFNEQRDSSIFTSKKKIIITRKIRLFIDVPCNDKELLNLYYRRLYTWQNIVFKAANLVSSHLFIEEQVKEFFYFQDDIRIKLVDRKHDKDGILDISQEGSLYRVISNKYKGEIPSSIAAALSHQLFLTFSKEKLSYFKGDRSLRSYRANIPVPVPSKSIRNLVFDEELKNYKFSFFETEKYKIPFRTYLGRDKSNNYEILRRCLSGEYLIHGSAYTLHEGKIYLLLSIEIPRKEHTLNPGRVAIVSLSFLAPLVVTYNG